MKSNPLSGDDPTCIQQEIVSVKPKPLFQSVETYLDLQVVPIHGRHRHRHPAVSAAAARCYMNTQGASVGRGCADHAHLTMLTSGQGLQRSPTIHPGSRRSGKP